MEIRIVESGLAVSGVIENEALKQHFEALAGIEAEDEFLKLITLGLKVHDAVQTTATAQILANSVEKVEEGLTALEAEHKDFIENLMLEVANPNSTSDLGLVSRLATWRSEFDKKLVDEFNPYSSDDNTLARIKNSVETHLKNRDAQLARLLSLDADPNGIEARPLKSVLEVVTAIQEKLSENAGAKKSTRGGSQKGKDFESSVYAIVQEIAGEYGDLAEDTGKQKAPGVAGNDEGDIVVDFAYIGTAKKGRLVLECKHSLTANMTSKSRLLSELDKGLANREADYGILVTNESNYGSPLTFPFWEDADHRRAILLVEDNHEEIDPNKVRFAYLLAKARVLDLKTDVDRAKLNQIQVQIQTIASSYTRMSKVKGSLTSAVSSLTELKGHVEYLDANVGENLAALSLLLDQLDNS